MRAARRRARRRLRPAARRATAASPPVQSLRMPRRRSPAGGPRTTGRGRLRWVGAWGKRDPAERHEHLGPVAVDRHLQGLGIGSAMLGRSMPRTLDVQRLTGWLETDKAVNVRFYQRFGYEVVEQAEVLGVPNWFMRRAARA